MNYQSYWKMTPPEAVELEELVGELCYQDVVIGGSLLPHEPSEKILPCQEVVEENYSKEKEDTRSTTKCNTITFFEFW